MDLGKIRINSWKSLSKRGSPIITAASTADGQGQLKRDALRERERESVCPMVGEGKGVPFNDMEESSVATWALLMINGAH